MFFFHIFWLRDTNDLPIFVLTQKASKHTPEHPQTWVYATNSGHTLSPKYFVCIIIRLDALKNRPTISCQTTSWELVNTRHSERSKNQTRRRIPNCLQVLTASPQLLTSSELLCKIYFLWIYLDRSTFGESTFWRIYFWRRCVISLDFVQRLKRQAKKSWANVKVQRFAGPSFDVWAPCKFERLMVWWFDTLMRWWCRWLPSFPRR